MKKSLHESQSFYFYRVSNEKKSTLQNQGFVEIINKTRLTRTDNICIQKSLIEIFISIQSRIFAIRLDNLPRQNNELPFAWYKVLSSLVVPIDMIFARKLSARAHDLLNYERVIPALFFVRCFFFSLSSLFFFFKHAFDELHCQAARLNE